MHREAKPQAQASANYFPPRRALPPFQALQAFEATARFGGVRRAAEFLSRDHAVISRHLRTMELWIGTKLIKRTPSGSVLTEAGVAYYNQIAGALDVIGRATDALAQRGKPRLQIGCTPEFALQWLWARLDRFVQENPGVDAEVRTAQLGPDESSPVVDAEIRFVPASNKPPAESTLLRKVAVARAPLIPVASRHYLRQAKAIRTPSDLLRQQLLHEENLDGWSCWFDAHEVARSVELTGPRLWQSLIVLDAARQGRGIALCDRLTAADDIEAGRLVEIGKESSGFAPKLFGTWYLVSRADMDAAVLTRFQRWLTMAILKSYSQSQQDAGRVADLAPARCVPLHD